MTHPGCTPMFTCWQIGSSTTATRTRSKEETMTEQMSQLQFALLKQCHLCIDIWMMNGWRYTYIYIHIYSCQDLRLGLNFNLMENSSFVTFGKCNNNPKTHGVEKWHRNPHLCIFQLKLSELCKSHRTIFHTYSFPLLKIDASHYSLSNCNYICVSTIFRSMSVSVMSTNFRGMTFLSSVSQVGEVGHHTPPFSPLLLCNVSGDALGTCEVNLSTSCPLSDP